MNYEIIQGKWMPSREDREYTSLYERLWTCTGLVLIAQFQSAILKLQYTIERRISYAQNQR